MTNTSKTNGSVQVMCVKKTDINGDTASYKLVKITFDDRDLYLVSVGFRGENEEAVIGTGLGDAERFFDMICRNSVTPCSFFDVLYDYCAKIQ